MTRSEEIRIFEKAEKAEREAEQLQAKIERACDEASWAEDRQAAIERACDKIPPTEKHTGRIHSVTTHPEKKRKFTEDEDVEREISELVQMFRDFGFSDSSEVSNYIRENKLGYKYKHISGYLELQNRDGDTWIFEGGIAPQYYKRICQLLELDNKHSDATVSDFESYNDRGI